LWSASISILLLLLLQRGIDSHGIGRLKPIYCDRIDDGILHPYKPIEIVKETETTALVDGALGMTAHYNISLVEYFCDRNYLMLRQ
jgi:LDH2 family malate/lactate/ureidoglycolate dehydrogenase